MMSETESPTNIDSRDTILADIDNLKRIWTRGKREFRRTPIVAGCAIVVAFAAVATLLLSFPLSSFAKVLIRIILPWTMTLFAFRVRHDLRAFAVVVIIAAYICFGSTRHWQYDPVEAVDILCNLSILLAAAFSVKIFSDALKNFSQAVDLTYRSIDMFLDVSREIMDNQKGLARNQTEMWEILKRVGNLEVENQPAAQIEEDSSSVPKGTDANERETA